MHLSRKWSAVVLGGIFAVTLGALGPAGPQANPPAAASPEPAALTAAPEAGSPDTADSKPPGIDVLTRRPGTADGLLFLTPQQYLDAESLRGPQIVDDRGRTVWFRPVEQGLNATNFRVQTYRGEPVLTWWEGTTTELGMGRGTGYIADENYEIIATVQTPDSGEMIDLHEFTLTPRGTALVVSYQDVPHDLRPVGGPEDGTAVDAVVQEIDIATGEVLLDWHSLDHVPLEETDHLGQGSDRLDYLHVNSVSLDTDGDLLISGRHASTVYKVDRETGEVIWRLGGRNSDFRLGLGARFIEQHDVQGEGEGVYRIFDNGAASLVMGYESRVVWVKIDEEHGTATLLRQQIHPELMSASAEGGAQLLPGGNTLVSWGWAGRVSEFSPGGELLFDAAMAPGVSSYRAYRCAWEGEPAGDPGATVDGASGQVHAIWNGATGVAEWRVLGGDSEDELRPLARAPWDGMDTPVPLPEPGLTGIDHLRVEALDERGRVIGASPVQTVDVDAS
ncbi:arylsulfotransferase family protein [Streptomyces sp. 6N223]|uniref:arylsulfotransferase family protein n=1 Tax=Streptomyces sp. 6N223 TaxID=3457412 RepID=UPI003FD1B983